MNYYPSLLPLTGIGLRWSTRKPNPDRKLNRKHFNHNDIFDDKKKRTANPVNK